MRKYEKIPEKPDILGPRGVQMCQIRENTRKYSKNTRKYEKNGSPGGPSVAWRTAPSGIVGKQHFGP